MSQAKERRRELKRAVWRSVAESLEEGARVAPPEQAEAMLAVARACRNAASGTNGKPVPGAGETTSSATSAEGES
jgi:hypothetical protein